MDTRQIKRLLKNRNFICMVFLVNIVLVFMVVQKTRFQHKEPRFLPYDPDLFANVEESFFEGFNNVTGTIDGSYIVPNHVHFLFFNKTFIPYVHAVCVLAAFKNQQPEKIFFHTNVDHFTGRHWRKIKDTLGSTLEIRNVTLPNEIFGQKLSKKFHLWHAGDITRIKILMIHGGIFLDNDSFVVRSLDAFRRYEMTIGVTDGNYLGTQVLVAHKDARFLRLWLETYRDYDPESWYFNAGQKPMREVLYYKPELVHTSKALLGVQGLADRLYIWDKWDSWRKYYSIHLIIRHRNYMDTLWNNFRWPYLDEYTICDYPKPFGEMAREIYSDYCPEEL